MGPLLLAAFLAVILTPALRWLQKKGGADGGTQATGLDMEEWYRQPIAAHSPSRGSLLVEYLGL